MNIKLTKLSFTLLFLSSIIILSCQSEEKKLNGTQRDEIIMVEYPEVYELANIIIALTEDGIKDEWKVKKTFLIIRK